MVYSTDCANAIRSVLSSNSPHRPPTRSYETHVGTGTSNPDADQSIRKVFTPVDKYEVVGVRFTARVRVRLDDKKYEAFCKSLGLTLNLVLSLI